MAKKEYERLSKSQYADRLGVSHTAVGKAIRLGAIKKGWDAERKQIIVEIANKEWGDTARKAPVIQSIDELIPPEKNEQGEKKAKLNIKADAPYTEARRVREVASAQLAIMELAEKSGKLVDKNQVQKALFDYGSEIRKAIEQLPERTIDKIRAAGTRNDAIKVMSDEIENILIRLTTVTTEALNKK